MQRVLVTGGAGLIGSHLCDRLVGDGHDVVAVDCLKTGSRDNLRGLLPHSGFELIHHDVIEPFDFDVDRIFHLACPASPVHYQTDPIHTLRTNVIGTMNVLELARRRGARVLIASTSEVYGDAEEHPQEESYRGSVNTMGPRACYDEGKRCAETLAYDYHRMHGVSVKVARIFNTYGPRMQPDDGRVISNFIVQALTNRDITVYGNGSQTRSLCYVDDTVEALVRLMDTERAFLGPVNIGNPDEHQISALANTIRFMVGSRSKIRHLPLPQDDPRQRCPDISLARSKLDWNPTTELQHGLGRTISYFRSTLGASMIENATSSRP